MTGGSHYRAAEELLAKAHTRIDPAEAASLLAEAQAHATLALVSAVAALAAERAGNRRD
jgi:hypothetical protein